MLAPALASRKDSRGSPPTRELIGEMLIRRSRTSPGYSRRHTEAYRRPTVPRRRREVTSQEYQLSWWNELGSVEPSDELEEPARAGPALFQVILVSLHESSDTEIDANWPIREIQLRREVQVHRGGDNRY